MLGDILNAAKWIGDKIFPPEMDPADRAAKEQVIAEMMAERDKAKASIIVAEMAQSDNYTKRARPTVVYAGLAMIAINHVIFPIVGRGVALWGDVAQLAQITPLIEPVVLPTAFWTAWGGIVSTWVLGRSIEKKGAQGKLGQVAEMITGAKSLFGKR